MKARTKLTRILKRSGFSLSEVVCALGLISVAMLPLLGVLAAGMDDAQKAASKRELAAMRGTVRGLLRDPAWPTESKGGGKWSATCWLDEQGMLLDGKATSTRWVKVALEGGTGMGYESDYLESVKLSFSMEGSKAVLDECVVQRVREVVTP